MASLHLYPLVRPHWTEDLQLQVCPADLTAVALADAFTNAIACTEALTGFSTLRCAKPDVAYQAAAHVLVEINIALLNDLFDLRNAIGNGFSF